MSACSIEFLDSPHTSRNIPCAASDTIDSVISKYAAKRKMFEHEFKFSDRGEWLDTRLTYDDLLRAQICRGYHGQYVQIFVEEQPFHDDFRQVMIDYDLGEYARNFQFCGIRSMQQIQMLWCGGEFLFGDMGYDMGSLLIVRVVLERFRAGHDTTLDVDAELYEVMRENKLLKDVWLLEQAGIRHVADIGKIWGAKKNFGVDVGSGRYGFYDLRYELEQAYSFETRNNTYLRIGAHTLKYVSDY